MTRTENPANFLIEANELRSTPTTHAPLLIDTRPAAQYALGHLPGAINLSTYDCFVPSTDVQGMLQFSREVAARYGAAGITRERAVVLYEAQTGMRAARDQWILEYCGHTGSRILHGGLAAWQAAGGTLTTQPPAIDPAGFVPALHPLGVIGLEELHVRLHDPALSIIDVRDATEFAGRDETACCARRGHIPGAKWMEWTTFLTQGFFKPPAEIRGMLEREGITDTNEVAVYCHRGARSANAYYALRRAGYGRVRNFIGSFHEWSARAEFPVEI